MKLPEKIEPYRGVIIFILILTISNLFWKYNVIGDESNTVVRFWSWDISSPFILLARHVAETVTSLLNTFGWDITLYANNVVRHADGNAAQIVWSCTGLKQAYIFCCILLFSRGLWLKKLWFIPLGLVVVYLFNIFRIAAIVAIIDKHPTWFDFIHLYFFKYAFYALIFGLWVLWEEKISIMKKK